LARRRKVSLGVVSLPKIARFSSPGSSAYSERGFELIPQELHDYYSKMNTSHHSPPAHLAHSAPPVRPASSTGIPSIAPPLSSFTGFDSAAGASDRLCIVLQSQPHYWSSVSITAHPSTGNSSFGKSSSAPASASSNPSPNEAFQNRINGATLGSESPDTAKPEKEEGPCDSEEGKGNATFTGHSEHDVRVEDRTEDDAEDKPA